LKLPLKRLVAFLPKNLKPIISYEKHEMLIVDISPAIFYKNNYSVMHKTKKHKKKTVTDVRYPIS
jgi:hypothetical protein